LDEDWGEEDQLRNLGFWWMGGKGLIYSRSVRAWRGVNAPRAMIIRNEAGRMTRSTQG
jgi:hypothetical protein